MTFRRKLKFLLHVFLAVLPNRLKCFCYRTFFGFRIGRGVWIGASILDVDRCVVGDGARVGHLNIFTQVKELRVGDRVRIGFGNLFRGGALIDLGSFSELMRLNRINAIPDPDCIGNPVPVLTLGEGSVITAEHRFDFTDRIEIGKCTVIGGRNSSFWTHNRQATKPIHIGSFAYIGSEVRFAPGAKIPSLTILGMGSVVTGPVTGEGCLIAGVPAKILRPLSDEDLALVRRKTRKDLPDTLYDDAGVTLPPTPALTG